jgi:hypothetical protein
MPRTTVKLTQSKALQQLSSILIWVEMLKADQQLEVLLRRCKIRLKSIPRKSADIEKVTNWPDKPRRSQFRAH